MLIECLVIWFQFLLLCIRAVNPLSQGCFGEGRLNKSVSILFAFPASDFERSAISQASLPGMCFLAGWAWASGMSLLLDPGTCLPLSRALVCLNIHNTTSCQPCEASVTHIKTVSRLQAPETWGFQSLLFSTDQNSAWHTVGTQCLLNKYYGRNHLLSVWSIR